VQKKLRVGNHAQTALCRLLHKLSYVNAEAVDKYDDTELCPIAFFALQGKINESEAINAVAAEMKISVIEITKGLSEDIMTLLDQEIFSRISAARWREIRALPVEMKKDRIVIVMANPFDHETKSSLEFALGRSVEIAIAREQEIITVLTTKDTANTVFNLDSILVEAGGEFTAERATEEGVSEVDISAPPIVRLVNKIFAEAIYHSASDIHINPEKDHLAVRIRVDGLLRILFTVPKKLKNPIISRIKLLCDMDIAERRRPQDGRLRVNSGYGKKDLRVSTLPTAHGETIVARILSSDMGRMTFESLGMDDKTEKMLKRALLGSSKVVLISGPTGSGKTSTLYAGLMHLKDGERNLVTIEDPVEYRIDGINQMQTNARIGLGFAQGLRAILRQDPDVIMVGEIRDGETAQVAMQVAQTGHLVLSSIHTNSASAAITRLRDLGIPSYLIASSIGMVVAQRLVRRLCPHCSVELSGKDLERCRELGLNPAGKRKASGCRECSDTGYKGRVAVYSCLQVSDVVREAIRQDKSEPVIERLARASGFISLEESGLEIYARGLTSISELERVLGSFDSVVEKRYSERSAGFALEAPTPSSAISSAGTVANENGRLVIEGDQASQKALNEWLSSASIEESEDTLPIPEVPDALKKIKVRVVADN
jgi:type IV pilus assembly protein PilB